MFIIQICTYSLHISDENFTCSECLTTSVCDDGEEVVISFAVHIDLHFIRMPECEILRDGLIPVCMIGSGKCSRVFTSYNRSKDYAVHCPILDTTYAIRSDRINLDGDLQPCTGKFIKLCNTTLCGNGM